MSRIKTNTTKTKMKAKILAIIPARGGSKGIPRKNIRLLAGKPLIAYTIEAARQSHKVDRVIVSTEDTEIAKIAARYGAEVIKRPEELAKDETPTIDVVLHILQVFKIKKNTKSMNAFINQIIGTQKFLIEEGYLFTEALMKLKEVT